MDDVKLNDEIVTVVDLDHQDRKKIIKEVKKLEKDITVHKKCITCGNKATHCMRGLAQNTYCKDCAKDYFKFLNYLERL